MRNFFALLLISFSVNVFAQTKEEAFEEMNQIFRKLEGQIITGADGDAIRITNQMVFPSYLFVVKSKNVTIGISVKNIPWESYRSVQEEESDFGNVSLSVIFDKKYEFKMKICEEISTGIHNELIFYVPKDEIERLKELFKIVSIKE